MSGIQGVGYSTPNYGGIASGKRLNSAADGAAELAIAEEEKTQISGYDVGNRNAESGKEALNIADGALGSVTSSLQRIRELALSSMNDLTTTASDRAMYQKEIDQLKKDIASTASNTQYNTKNLLDGSQGEFNIATDGNGGSTSISMTNSTLEALGIADFDVTKDFHLEDIDNALEMVSKGRSTMGAQYNGLEYLQNYNSYASYNHTSSLSRVEDLDIPQAVEEKKKQEALMQYSLMMQKKKEEDEEKRASMFWT
jgi:flagellin